MLCFAVMNLTTTAEFDIREIRQVDKQKIGKKRSVKKTLGSWNTGQLVSSVAEEKRASKFSVKCC